MGEEEVGDLDFDTYFNVTSNTMQSAHQRQQQMVYNQTNTLQRPIEAPRLRYPSQPFYASQNTQQPSYEMFSWYVNPQQPISSDTPVFTGTQALPRPEYFYPAATAAVDQFNSARSELPQQQPPANEEQQTMRDNYLVNSSDIIYRISDQTNHLLFSAGASGVNNTGLITPISDEISPQFQPSLPSPESNSPTSINSPPDNLNLSIGCTPVTNPLKTTEQCTENKDQDCHETRNWRKTKNDYPDSNTHLGIVEAAVAAVASSRKPIVSGKQFKKVAHNAIERRYRKNINERILDLKNVVPALYKASPKGHKSSSGNEFEDSSEEDNHHQDKEDTHEIVDGVEVAKKLNKATILHKATEYIHHLKHSNDLAERENRVLLQILAQVPGGAEVLAEFQIQKLGHKQAEQDRLIAQRKESMDHEKIEHQRMLRERAAQRAALAELVPKPERKPYPRRVKKTNIAAKVATTDASDSQKKHSGTINAVNSISADNAGNKAFLAMFLGVALISPLSFEKNTTHTQHSYSSYYRQGKVHSLPNDVPMNHQHHDIISLFTVLCVFAGILISFKILKQIRKL